MIALDSPVNMLISFHYFHRADVAELAGLGLRLIGDSGAYSASSQGTDIDPDKFQEWQRQWRDYFYWTASLDVIGDVEASWRNWITNEDRNHLVPTLHYGTDPAAMGRYVQAGADLIGLGGMVPYKSEPQRLLRWCLSVMRYARDNHPQVRFHGWGVTHPALVMNLPWWSVDSSGFSSAYRFGVLKLWDPTVGKSKSIRLDGRTPAKFAGLLEGVYGVNWRDVATSHPDNRSDLVRLSIRSMQLLQTFLQRRHNVKPPESLEGTASAGPLVHFVDSVQQHMRYGAPEIGPSLFGATSARDDLLAVGEAP